MLPVEYLPHAKDYLKKIKDKQLKNEFEQAIMAIRRNPRIGESKKGDLQGVLCYGFKHQGQPYEVAYVTSSNAQNNVVLVIIMAGTQENFYKQLKRYLK